MEAPVASRGNREVKDIIVELAITTQDKSRWKNKTKKLYNSSSLYYFWPKWTSLFYSIDQYCEYTTSDAAGYGPFRENRLINWSL